MVSSSKANTHRIAAMPPLTYQTLGCTSFLFKKRIIAAQRAWHMYKASIHFASTAPNTFPGHLGPLIDTEVLWVCWPRLYSTCVLRCAGSTWCGLHRCKGATPAIQGRGSWCLARITAAFCWVDVWGRAKANTPSMPLCSHAHRTQILFPRQTETRAGS